MVALTNIPIRRSPTETPQWVPATWADYIAACNDAQAQQADYFRVYFNQGYLFVDMGWEGISHSKCRELLTMIFTLWFVRQPDIIFEALGGCIIEKPEQRGASPDEVLYVGESSPRWQPGESRRVNLRQWRVPNLVCEVGDTTLASDLDEKKEIYAALEVPEYWVIDVQGLRVIAFLLQADGRYQQCDVSEALSGLKISLVERTFARLANETNGSAAQWFAQQISG
ncbi:Uma2 family endonuclease [cf. Phormidesmis sp. LEGE 11477]|uniref:Uma2 family endonuclease n=1 Tax=cf. Phormidesmis sp. LEGE 11477 TaxID=1828680 RepID=UPI00188276F5|nr:Uma2 family endonuclease [cf. Phormidesmis sp. LEGE 11477]MBE9060064.1 Uma2 family endonuclease [cf. Phormidesmis sp. LEGE 11477]